MKIILVVLLLTSCSKEKEDLYSLKPSGQENIYQHEKVLPTCEEVCPKDFRVLKGKKNDRDYLAFANFGYRGIGRCRGHAIVNQKVYELSNFKQDSKLNCNTPNLSNKCKEIISDKLFKLMKFEVQNFPGFTGLYDFSNHPEVQRILKTYIRGISHRFKASRAHIRDNSYDNINESIFNEIILRVKENQRPYIGIQGAKVGHHAVIAHTNEFIAGESVICVHDSNIIFHKEADHCHNYISIKDGNVYYKRYEKEETILNTFLLTNDEDKRVAKYIQARHSYCMNINRAQNLCK